MKTVMHGVIYGKTIELPCETGFADGQQVAVTMEAVLSPPGAPGEGIRQSAGGWAEDAAALDEYLEWNRQQRKATRRSIEA